MQTIEVDKQSIDAASCSYKWYLNGLRSVVSRHHFHPRLIQITHFHSQPTFRAPTVHTHVCRRRQEIKRFVLANTSHVLTAFVWPHILLRFAQTPTQTMHRNICSKKDARNANYLHLARFVTRVCWSSMQKADTGEAGCVGRQRSIGP